MKRKTKQRKPAAPPKTKAKGGNGNRELISQSDYAKRRGVTRQFINKLVKSGDITLVRGKIDPAIADKQREAIAHLDREPFRKENMPDVGLPGAEAPPPPLTDSPPDNGDPKQIDFRKAQAAREWYNAELARLTLEERLGILIDTETFIPQLQDALTKRDQAIRKLLLAIPKKGTPLLFGIKKKTTFAKKLGDLINECLAELRAIDIDKLNN